MNDADNTRRDKYLDLFRPVDQKIVERSRLERQIRRLRVKTFNIRVKGDADRNTEIFSRMNSQTSSNNGTW